MNKVLHALSNRNVFTEPMFAGNKSFLKARIAKDYEELRRALFLHLEDTDYYLKVYINLLMSWPELWDLFKDTETSFSLVDFAPLGVRLTGGDLLSNTGLHGYYTDPVIVSLPVPTRFQINYHSSAIVKFVSLDEGHSDFAAYHVTDNDILTLNWPEGAPFQGPLKLNQNWQSGSRVEIDVEPSKFPYDLMLKRVETNAFLNRLMADLDLLDEYAGSFEPETKLALVAAAVAFNHPSFA